MNLGIAHVDTLLRWLHVLAGIVWVGHLCFFNFAGGPFLASLDAETKKKIYPGLMGRALWWFRWGAMATLVFGVALFLFAMMKLGLYSKGPDGEFPGRMRFIMWGMTFAVILWINVWFVIWPAQKKIIAAFSRGDAPPAGLPQRAALFSKVNTYLSGPMLIMMVAAGQHGAFSYVDLGLAIVVGVAVMHMLMSLGKTVGRPA
ncbi:MAG: urate hydroxylase PuuD [Planctomycetes bacterium]|nr:urate hydroxylase PuuD [Planctomycetota bacterium]